MAHIRTFHHSGKWSRSAQLLEASVKRTRRGGFSIGTRTEMGHKSQDEVLRADEHWGVYHPFTHYGLADCSIEWDLDEWVLVAKGFQALSSMRYSTAKGYLLPPVAMPWVRLRHLDHGELLDVGVSHMSLSNTSKRRRSWNLEAASVHNWLHGPLGRDRNVLYQADTNRNQRLKPNQWKVNRRIIRGTGAHNLWLGNLPPKGQGTHGKAVLDVAISNLVGSSFLLPDDASSDHRPFGSALVL